MIHLTRIQIAISLCFTKRITRDFLELFYLDQNKDRFSLLKNICKLTSPTLIYLIGYHTLRILLFKIIEKGN